MLTCFRACSVHWSSWGVTLLIQCLWWTVNMSLTATVDKNQRPYSDCRQIRFVPQIWVVHRHCYLQAIRLDLLHPDIAALYRPICMCYCGNDIGVSMCAGEQLYNMEVRRLEKCRYKIHLAVQTRCQIVVLNSAAPDRLSYRTDG